MQFIYILKVIDRLILDAAWTDEDNKIVEEHFINLQRLQKEGKLILAGRTSHEGEDSFGIVIIKGSREEAQHMMENDPAIKKGIMTGKLYPYSLALISEDNV